MAIVGMRDVSWGFGGLPLLDNITLQIEKGDRKCIIGRNGVGKSTMLKLISGELIPDNGEVWRQQGITIAALEQGVDVDLDIPAVPQIAADIDPCRITQGNPVEHQLFGAHGVVLLQPVAVAVMEGFQYFE